jgi:hypothetical protein
MILALIIQSYLACSINATQLSDIQTSLKKEKIDRSSSPIFIQTLKNKRNNLKNFPFRFGAEFGTGASFENKFTLVPGVLGFLDINIYRTIAFIKLEYGRLFKFDSDDNAAAYGSLGLNYRIAKINRSRLHIHGAVAGAGNESGGSIFFSVSIRYLYAVDDYIGLGASLRYPFLSLNTMFLSVGIQFFTN